VASVGWTLGARDEPNDRVKYIGRDSPTFAAALSGRIVASVRGLRRHPRLGRVVPELGDETLRELIVGAYRVVYRVRGQRVGIIAVVHGSRDLQKHLQSGAWDLG
jgi:plasmid stabilization system protein ParE